jgi:hypothetical protein
MSNPFAGDALRARTATQWSDLPPQITPLANGSFPFISRVQPGVTLVLGPLIRSWALKPPV